MSEESWHQARLIPTSGISGAEEQERRATSALLAVAGAVREFGRVLTQRLGAPAGSVETFIEVPFVLEGKRYYPDGLIRVRRGQKIWTALIEAKTGSSSLEAQQLENYLDIAKAQGFDAVITISNEIPPQAGQHPVQVDRRKLKTVAMHHYSWSQILAEAVIQKEHRGVADPEQAWILSELIRYLEHPRSGALEFDDMGASWVPVRDAVISGTLRSGDVGVSDVVNRFDALLRYVSLRLGRQLGTEVVPLLSRKEQADPSVRSQSLVTSLTSQGTLSGAIRIPEAVGPIVVTTDLRAGSVTCHVDIDAPKDGRATTRINWIVRQLRAAPPTTRLEAFAAYGRSSTAELLGTVRDNPSVLVADPAREIRSFRVALDQQLGVKRGKGKGGYVDSVRTSVETLYVDVLQGLKAWTVAAPKIREEPPAPVEPVAERLISSSLSSQDNEDSPQSPSATLMAQSAPVADKKPLAMTSAAVTEATAEAPSTGLRPVAVLSTVDVARPRLPTRRELRLLLPLPDAGDHPADQGWYQSAGGNRVLRWWTGDAWSTHVHEIKP